jgi:cyclopropane fatty-acyl-phospholipid synthase-like methyltransferase
MNLKGMSGYLNEKKKGALLCKNLIGKRVLDIGCGAGEQILDKKNWIGIDTSMECVEECLLKGITAKQISFTEIGGTFGKFDGIICNQLLEHLTPQEAMELFKTISQLLNKNGVAYISSPLAPVVWNTIDHTRPYHPSAISKFLKQGKVHHKYEGVAGMEVEWVFYTSGNKILTILANVLPVFRDGYVMKIRKVK